MNWKLHGDTRCCTVAKGVEKYLDFEALVYWLRPFFWTPTIQLPAQVVLEMEREWRGLHEFASTRSSAPYRGKLKSWESLFSWGKVHVLAQAKKEGWFDYVLCQILVHPLHVRMADYGELCFKSPVGKTALPYRSLRQWQSDMEVYVRATRK